MNELLKAFFLGYVIFVDIMGLWFIINMFIDLVLLIRRRMRIVAE